MTRLNDECCLKQGENTTGLSNDLVESPYKASKARKKEKEREREERKKERQRREKERGQG